MKFLKVLSSIPGTVELYKYDDQQSALFINTQSRRRDRIGGEHPLHQQLHIHCTAPLLRASLDGGPCLRRLAGPNGHADVRRLQELLSVDQDERPELEDQLLALKAEKKARRMNSQAEKHGMESDPQEPTLLRFFFIKKMKQQDLEKDLEAVSPAA